MEKETAHFKQEREYKNVISNLEGYIDQLKEYISKTSQHHDDHILQLESKLQASKRDQRTEKLFNPNQTAEYTNVQIQNVWRENLMLKSKIQQLEVDDSHHHHVLSEYKAQLETANF